MSIVDDCAEFFTDQVTVTRKVHDYWGVPSGAVSVTAYARVSRTINKIRRQDGVEIVSSLMATFRGIPEIAGTPIKATDYYTLPATFDPREVTAQSVETPRDENGPLFVRVFF